MELGSALSAGFLISDCDLDADDAELDSVVGTVDTSTDAVGGMLNLRLPTATKLYSNLRCWLIIGKSDLGGCAKLLGSIGDERAATEARTEVLGTAES